MSVPTSMLGGSSVRTLGARLGLPCEVTEYEGVQGDLGLSGMSSGVKLSVDLLRESDADRICDATLG